MVQSYIGCCPLFGILTSRRWWIIIVDDKWAYAMLIEDVVTS